MVAERHELPLTPALSLSLKGEGETEPFLAPKQRRLLLAQEHRLPNPSVLLRKQEPP